jgi:NADH-quinone oxidoreductase subunit H
MNAAQMIVALVAGSIGTMVLGLASKWVDRKVTARIQWRVGPPWYQPAMDCLKLLGKETVVPAVAQGTGFLLAPLVGFPAMSTILGAAASGSPHATIGATREMKLLISYELPLIMALLVAIVHTHGSFRLGHIVLEQQQNGIVLGSISGVLACLVVVLCVQAKLGLIPFDQAEAETELMAGVYTEYSGPPLAMIFLTRAMLLATLPILVMTMFLGGIGLSGWHILYSVIAFVVLLVIVTLIRNTNPRLRIDQSVRFFWMMVTPIALLALILALIGRQLEVPWL